MTTDPKSGSDIARPTIGATLRANPIPLALVGFGLAWLLAENTGVIDSLAAEQRMRAAGRRIGETIGRRTGDGLAASQEQAQGWVHQATDAARGAFDSMRSSGASAVERAGQFAGEAGERAANATDRLAELVERHPLLVGALGLVSGAALAALLPTGNSPGNSSGKGPG